MGSKTALTWVSSTQNYPWLLTIHRPQEDKRRDHTPEHPRFSPDSYTKLWGKFLFIWQKEATALKEQETCQSLDHRGRKRDGGAAAWSFRVWVLHHSAGASTS